MRAKRLASDKFLGNRMCAPLTRAPARRYNQFGGIYPKGARMTFWKILLGIVLLSLLLARPVSGFSAVFG